MRLLNLFVGRPGRAGGATPSIPGNSMAESQQAPPADEPVLAQIPHGTPGKLYWFAVRGLVFVVSLTGLLAFQGAQAPTPGAATGTSGTSGLHLLLLGLAAAILPGLVLHRWLRERLIARFGGVQQPVRPFAFPVAQRAVTRYQALACLLGPATLLTVGCLGLFLAFLVGPVPLALEWTVAAYDVALGLRLLREAGCTQVRFRREGTVLFGSPARAARRGGVRRWLAGGVVGGALGLPVSFLVFEFVRPVSATPFLPQGQLLWLGTWLVCALAIGFVWTGTVRYRTETRQRRRLLEEADAARRRQRGLLPAAPPQLAGCDIAALFHPAREVSGDFYLFPAAPPGRVRLVLADVAGKGMSAALTGAMTAGFLNAAAQAAGDPVALLLSASDSLRGARSERAMVAACAFEVEPTSGRLTWCNAGVPSPALLRTHRVEWLPGAGTPLGTLPGPRYQAHERVLAAGDLLLLYSDGLLEATGPFGEQFGKERLVAFLRDLPTGCTASELLDRLVEQLTRFVGEAEQYDDVTAVALRFG